MLDEDRLYKARQINYVSSIINTLLPHASIRYQILSTNIRELMKLLFNMVYIKTFTKLQDN